MCIGSFVTSVDGFGVERITKKMKLLKVFYTTPS